MKFHTFYTKNLPEQLITELAKKKIKIVVFGDYLNIKNIKNCGFINNEIVKKLQSISKFTFCSNENIYSLFITECISNNVKILISKLNKNKIKYFKKYFIPVNFENKKYLYKLIVNE